MRLYERSTLGGRLGSEELGDRQVGLGATYVKARHPVFKVGFTLSLMKDIYTQSDS